MGGTPVGVVGIFVGPDGHEVASVCDFDLSGYGGFTTLQAQTLRVKNAIAREVAERLCSSEFTKHLNTHEMVRVIGQMEDRDGYKLHIVPVGHTDAR